MTSIYEKKIANESSVYDDMMALCEMFCPRELMTTI
jgi:hypothetical protein